LDFYEIECCDRQKLIGLGCFQKSEYYSVTTLFCVNCLTDHIIEDFPDLVEVQDEDWEEVFDEDWIPDEEELKRHKDDLRDWFNEQLDYYYGYRTEMMPDDERDSYEAEVNLEEDAYKTERWNADGYQEFQDMLDDHAKMKRDEAYEYAEEESYYEVIKIQTNHLKYSHFEHHNCIMKNHLTEYQKIFEIHFKDSN